MLIVAIAEVVKINTVLKSKFRLSGKQAESIPNKLVNFKTFLYIFLLEIDNFAIEPATGAVWAATYMVNFNA